MIINNREKSINMNDQNSILVRIEYMKNSGRYGRNESFFCR